MIYCIFCGEENEKKDKQCKKCKRELNPSSHLFRNYVIDKCEGDIGDTLFHSILRFLKTKLYGIVLSVCVIATSTVLITNAVSNNYIEELKEEPTFHYVETYSYLGEGLSENEVVDRYLEAVQKGNREEANGYLATHFLSEEQLEKIPLDRADKKLYPKLKHDFLENSHSFFDHIENMEIDRQNFVGRFSMLDALEPETIHNEEFNLSSHYMELSYLLSDGTEVQLMEILETVTIDGNTYILSEYAFLTDNYSRVVRYLFNTYQGNFGALDSTEFYRVMDSCVDMDGKVICDLPLPEFGEE